MRGQIRDGMSRMETHRMDALHVAICQRLDATVVTLDRRLAEAAGALGLRVHVPRR